MTFPIAKKSMFTSACKYIESLDAKTMTKFMSHFLSISNQSLFK